MRRAVLFSIVGVVLLAGFGVAMAALRIRTDPPNPPSTATSTTTSSGSTTTTDSVDTAPQEITSQAPGAVATTTRPKTGASTSTTGASSATTTTAPGAAPATLPSAPGQFFNPFQPFNPRQPVQPFPTDQPAPAPGGSPAMVQPHPGMENLHKTRWDRVEAQGAQSIRVYFVSGVAPCTVLDHVEVDYRSSDIVITLFEGSDPAHRNEACVMIAQEKAVDVQLDQPIAARTFTDGAS